MFALCVFVTLLLALFKLAGVVAVSWWIVALPVLAALAAVTLAFASYFLFIARFFR